MARPMNTTKAPSIPVIVWANIVKWAIVRGVKDDEIAAVLGVKNLADRKRKRLLTIEEMEHVCDLLAVEPEKLLER